jgi:hypothetical protein
MELEGLTHIPGNPGRRPVAIVPVLGVADEEYPKFDSMAYVNAAGFHYNNTGANRRP